MNDKTVRVCFKKNIDTKYIPFIYISMIWLTSNFGIPLAAFKNIPIYVLFTMVSFLFMTKNAFRQAGTIFCVLIIYELLKAAQPNFSFSIKGGLGIIAFSIIVPVTKNAWDYIKKTPVNITACWLKITLWVIFLAVLIVQAISLSGIYTWPDYSQRNYFFGTPALAGLFQEPSHIGLGLTPYIFLAIYDHKIFKRYLGRTTFVILILTSLFCPSSTLLAIVGMSFLVLVIKNFLLGNMKVAIYSVTLFLIALLIIFAIPQFTERVYGVFSKSAAVSLQTSQYSALAFLKGYQMTYYAFWHFPLGVAFLNMEYLAPQSIISYMNPLLYELNSSDGTSILFKGICEMGVGFIIFVLSSVYSFYKQLKGDGGDNFIYIVSLAFQFTFFVSFIRGGSYYYGIVTLAISIFVYSFYDCFFSLFKKNMS